MCNVAFERSHLSLQLPALSFLLPQARAELLPLRVELGQLLLHPRLHSQGSPPLLRQLRPQELTGLRLLAEKAQNDPFNPAAQRLQ